MIKINNTTVPFSISTKFFGMYIDNNLTWNAHTKHINKKLSNGEGVFSHFINELPHEILLLIYNTLIQSYLIYCCITWGFTYSSYNNEIFADMKNV